MKINGTTQGDLFAVPVFDTQAALLGVDGRTNLIVIGCGQRKKTSRARASALYVSERFQASKALAGNLAAPYVILSGKHGVVAPDECLDPYDVDVSAFSDEAKSEWANTVLDNLYRIAREKPITILAEGSYLEPVLVLNANRKKPLKIIAPFAAIDKADHKYWLDQALQMSLRIRDLKRLYTIIDKARENGRTFRLGDLKNHKVPKRGVYVFLDSDEKNFMGSMPRIVRIGTHAVSAGSKATLRNRLRNHLGKSDGLGNHRGSVFRLHIGKAMLNADPCLDRLPFWGIGQDATVAIRASETDLEKRVSGYLGGLEVFIIPIDDEPSKNSLRAHVETQLIALCTEGFQTIDRQNPGWLGRHSAMMTIAKIGMWNLRDVGEIYKSDGIGAVDYIESIKGLI